MKMETSPKILRGFMENVKTMNFPHNKVWYNVKTFDSFYARIKLRDILKASPDHETYLSTKFALVVV